MDEKNIRQEALQMSRDLTSMVDQDQADSHEDLTDCIKMVAWSVWHAAWRQAREDQDPDAELAEQVNHLIDHDDFLTLALYRHNWRNVSAVLAAFRDAGLAGSADIAAFYTHVDHIPARPSNPLPEWCGECDGPEPGRRFLDVSVPEGEPKLVRWCPRCEPRSAEYQAAQARKLNGEA